MEKLDLKDVLISQNNQIMGWLGKLIARGTKARGSDVKPPNPPPPPPIKIDDLKELRDILNGYKEMLEHLR
ncbi:MAG: hypothetical protein NTV01_15700 [Bacteroidia bacterium]|nr:hypothetical protein [Bacteroidia bacterium]